MKLNLREEIKNFKRLLGEATTTASSGAYEQPLGYNQTKPTSPCPGSVAPLVGSEIGTQAPTVDIVDITTQGSPIQAPPVTPTNSPAFDDMPYLSSHPSNWSFEGDEEEFLQTHGITRPTAPTASDEEAMSVAFDELDDEEEIGLDTDEEDMSVAFDTLDDNTDVFNTLKMFTETKNGLGWK